MEHPRNPLAPFTPPTLRRRHDGWTADKQVGFIEALAESACVDDACKRVGMSRQSAYALRRRVDAQSFRAAWDCALDYAVRRLSDAAFSRALNGVTRPVFYKGEQVGEKTYYDERLTMFMLRYRDPLRYGKWLDHFEARQHPDGPALKLSRAAQQVEEDAMADELGLPRAGGAVLAGQHLAGDDDDRVDDDCSSTPWGLQNEGDVAST
jgi:hypothetical protein